MRLAIIPARSGSKRIPGKNIKDFFGKPLISYTIQTALDSGLFDEVMVSTDCDEIKKISEQFNATVPFLRSSENSSDHATTASVIAEVLNRYKKDFKKEFLEFCCIYPTSPLLSFQSLKESSKLFSGSEALTLISTCKFSYPIQRALVIKAGKLELSSPEFKDTRSQDLPDAFHDAGQFYWGKTESFLKEPQIFTENSIGFELPEMKVQDIDNPSDWEIAELKYKSLLDKK